jgi:UDP-N-acetylglucosamine acyltransferase
VRIGAESVIGPNTVIESNTTIGRRNQIFHLASIGARPQDLKFKGEPSVVEIGDDNQIREFTTIHRGTEGGGMVTRIGSHSMIMNYVHIAHDCIVGDHCILSNSTQLAGHIVLEDHVRTMGEVGIHQFVRIGSYAMLAAAAQIELDVPPYTIARGDRASLVGAHEVGLQRAGFPPETIALIKKAIRTLFFGKGRREDSIANLLEEDGRVPEVRHLITFIQNSKRGVIGRERE